MSARRWRAGAGRRLLGLRAWGWGLGKRGSGSAVRGRPGRGGRAGPRPRVRLSVWAQVPGFGGSRGLAPGRPSPAQVAWRVQSALSGPRSPGGPATEGRARQAQGPHQRPWGPGARGPRRGQDRGGGVSRVALPASQQHVDQPDHSHGGQASEDDAQQHRVAPAWGRTGGRLVWPEARSGAGSWALRRNTWARPACGRG